MLPQTEGSVEAIHLSAGKEQGNRLHVIQASMPAGGKKSGYSMPDGK